MSEQASSLWQAAQRVLAVRLDNMGDVIMLGPALRAFKAGAPAARLTLLASPAGSEAAKLLPEVDDTITWRAVWQDLGSLPFDPARELQLIESLAARRFDAALIFTSFSQTPHVPGYVCYMAGIPLRAGESKEFGGGALSTVLPPAGDELHQVERNLRLVEALGFPAQQRAMAVTLPSDARPAVPRLLAGVGLDPAQPFVLLHPGASAKARRYPPERMGATAQLLAEAGLQVLLTGVEREAGVVAAVQAQAPGARTLLGGTTLGEYAALVERAALVVCGNTLPLHLADALGTPVLALYAGTDLETQWRPRFSPHRLLRRPTACYPCYRFECPIGLPCLDIPPAEVAAVALALLGERASLPQQGKK